MGRRASAHGQLCRHLHDQRSGHRPTAVLDVDLAQQLRSGGSIVEEFFPVYEPIALSPARTLSHTYTLYSQADGQLYDRPVAGTTPAGTFEFSLKVSTTGTATGTMNYSVGGCDSGPLTIKARRR